MYASVKIPLHTVANVLTVPMQAVQSTGSGKGIVLLVNAANQDRTARSEAGLAIRHATSKSLSGLSENETVIFGEQGQFKAGRTGCLQNSS